MTTQTRHGLKLTFENGQWLTADREYIIGRVRAVEFCESPHPMRVGRFGANVSYCPGNNEHDRAIGWDIRTSKGHDFGAGDLFGTLNEAWIELAKALRDR